MSNVLAIAAVTSTLRHLLDQALGGPQPGPVGSATVTTLRPEQLAGADDVGAAAKGINVFLYQVSVNHAWDQTTLPTRRADGSLTARPVAALDLHYLITCYGDENELDSQRLLARAVLALTTTPVLGRDVVAQALQEYAEDPATAFLAASDLAEQVELVKLAPAVLGLEDLSRLWGVLGTPYLLSATYTATVVLIEADLVPRTALPVRQRVVAVAPTQAPQLAEVSTDPPGGAVVTGAALLLHGSGLRGPVTAVRVGPAELDPGSTATANLLRVTVSSAVPAGVHALQVVHRSVPGPDGAPAPALLARSNAVPVLVRPKVVVASTTAAQVTLSVSPPLYPGQRATVTLSALDGAPGAPIAFTLAQLAPDAAPSADVLLDRADIPDGAWLVRIVVDGAESLPELDGEIYAAPALRLP
jgi:hypothetical protein